MSGRDFMRPTFAPQRLEPCFCGSGRRFRSCCGSLDADRDPPHGAFRQPGFLDRDTCRAWIEYLATRPGTALGVLGLDRDESRLVEQSTPTRVTDCVSAGELRAAVNDAVRLAYTTVIPQATGRTFAWFERPQVLRYEPGGWYSIHADSENPVPGKRFWTKHIDRDYSLLIYLNEDFEGGGLELVNFHYRYQPRTGDLLFFPADNRYLHQALPVKSGVRWVVVSWAAFADEPKVHDEPTADSIALD